MLTIYKKIYNLLHMKDKQFNLRIEQKTIDKIKEIADKESAKLGYPISKTAIILKAINSFIDGYK